MITSFLMINDWLINDYFFLRGKFGTNTWIFFFAWQTTWIFICVANLEQNAFFFYVANLEPNTWIIFWHGKLGTKHMDCFLRGKLETKHMDFFSLIFSLGMSTHVTLKEVTDINIFQMSCWLMPVDVDIFSDPHLRCVGLSPSSHG